MKIMTRTRARRNAEAKSKGRHLGYGKRLGTSQARLAHKTLWIKHIRVLRNLLRKYRVQEKIDKHYHRILRRRCKGNAFKNKRALVDAIHFEQAEIALDEALGAQIEAHSANIPL